MTAAFSKIGSFWFAMPVSVCWGVGFFVVVVFFQWLFVERGVFFLFLLVFVCHISGT